jgi:LPS export ABC transporter protein LptC
MTKNYYVKVQRHKFLLIIVAIICIFIIFITHLFSDSGISLEHQGEKDPSKHSKSEIDVKYPVITSNGDNAYKITAKKISKGMEDRYRMDQVSGIYHLKDQENLTINAEKCDINNNQDYMLLNRDVKIGYEDYVMYTESVDVDLSSKKAQNSELVRIIGQKGRIKANSFKTTEEFCEITFDGSVKAHFDLDSDN